MSESEFIQEADMEMQEVIESTQKELNQLRTGRASPALLDGVMVDAYGTKTPLKQVANVSVPEARLIVVQPWDKSILGDVEKAILAADIGITPNNDGKMIRLNIPPMTEERRKDVVKTAKKIGEDGKVRIRHLRRDSIDSLKKAEKEGSLSEDESKHLQEEVQKLTDKHTHTIDEILKDKEHEIMNF